MSLKDFIILSKLGILFGSYHILGSGSFSEVFKVKRITDNKIYALKGAIEFTRRKRKGKFAQ